MPQKTKKTEFFNGTPKEAAAKLVEKLRTRRGCYEHSGHYRTARRQVESGQSARRWRRRSRSPRRPAARLAAVVIGKGVRALADELAANKLDEVLLVEHDLLEHYTPTATPSRCGN